MGDGNKSRFLWQIELGNGMNFFCMTLICNHIHLRQINNVYEPYQQWEEGSEVFLYLSSKNFFPPPRMSKFYFVFISVQ